MPTPEPTTLRLRLYWSYANLAMAHAAVEQQATKYGRLHWMIRARLYKGLHTGSMNIRSLLDDEKVKLGHPDTCAYCGAKEILTLDHLLPKTAGGLDSADNIVWACRSCNSSKGGRDALVWYPTRHHETVPLLLVRRYLKLALSISETRGVLDSPLEELPELPFDPLAIPASYAPPSACRLWAVAH